MYVSEDVRVCGYFSKPKGAPRAKMIGKRCNRITIHNTRVRLNITATLQLCSFAGITAYCNKHCRKGSYL